MSKSNNLLFSYGLISDIQYADFEDGFNYDKTVKRRYRNSLEITQKAVQCWNNQIQPIQFVIQLGDIIDGKCKSNESQDCALKAVIDILEQSICNKIYHVVGNHELYCFDRKYLNQKFGQSIYSFEPNEQFRFIVLDSFDISCICPLTYDKQYALDYIKKYNPNDCTKDGDWTIGLTGYDQRYVPYNGGISQQQINYLKNELSVAKQKNQKVVIFSHIAIIPMPSSNSCIVWNYEDVLPIIQQCDNVVACFYGHYHEGDYLLDDFKIHHFCVAAPLQSMSQAYGIVDVYNDRLFVRGVGEVPSMDLQFRLCTPN